MIRVYLCFLSRLPGHISCGCAALVVLESVLHQVVLEHSARQSLSPPGVPGALWYIASARLPHCRKNPFQYDAVLS